ncbi:MAG: cupin domain-containing protein [Candidatus Binataceae bacterium]
MIRRVVSGINVQGASCVSIDGEPGKILSNNGFVLAEVWATDSPAPDLKDKRDLTAGIEQFSMDLAPGATRFRVVEFPPGHASMMHKTPTIDYLVVLEGEIDLAFEDGSEVHLKPGDCIIQQGDMHAWRNRGSGRVRMAAVAVGGVGGENTLR